MFSLRENCSDNHVDNNYDKSRSYVNFFTSINNFPDSKETIMEREHQFEIRKCKSESSFEENSRIEKMDSTSGKAKSHDCISSTKFKFEPLTEKKVVTKDENSLSGFEDSDDEYELLEETEDHDSEQDLELDIDIANELTSQPFSKTIRDGKEITESTVCSSEYSQTTSKSVVMDDLFKLSSTLPRVKVKNNGQFSRCSMPNKSFNDDRSNYSKPTGNSEESYSEENFDKAMRSTTLPKTRSRFGKSHFRHSLRQAFNFAQLRKHASSSNASKNITIDIPNTSEQANNDLENKDKSNTLSWLRRSMKKLNPFELPQVAQSETTGLNIHVESTTDENEAPKPSRVEHEATTQYSSNPDLFNILLTEQQQNSDLNRPRQYGRRSDPIQLSSVSIESSNIGAARIIAHHQHERRPASAPVQRFPNIQQNVHMSRVCLPSEPSSLASSRNSSPVSIASSTGSSSVADPVIEVEATRPRFFSVNRSYEEEGEGESSNESNIFWPHSLSRPICCLFCSLGLFNISRFAIFSVHFGANFLVQFLILSFVFGIPLIWLQMVLGQKIKGGVVTLFRISPICKGIGVALMAAHCLISLYTSVSVGWLLIYLRDSVISADKGYLWQERFDSFRNHQNISAFRLSENIADYFNGVVLQRLSAFSNIHDGKMRFQLAFNVSIVWFLVFIMLCRGIRSLGQIVIGIAMFCFLGLSAVCIKFLTLLSFETVQDIFPATDWQEFFANSSSWFVAAQEAFLTWGLLGVSVYTVYCKTGKNQRPSCHVLRREALLVVFLTLFGLFLGAVLGSTCIMILKSNGFNYYPASFENPKNDIFLWPTQHSTVPNFHRSIPSRWITRYSNILGESFERPIFVNQQGVQVFKESGYKTLRLVTEMLPATLAVSSRIEPFWGTIAFASLFFFGLAQLSMMWKPICGVIGNSTSAILLSCITGLFLGFPLTTDNGLVIMHYLDFIFGGTWWLLILWASYIIAIFMIRGRPFTSDVLVKDLKLSDSLSAFLAFSWNVLLPLALILLSVMEYKKSHSNELFHQKNIPRLNHLANWATWAKQLGGFLQLVLLVLVPCISLIQIYIFLTKGPPDILDCIELLFRPPMETTDSAISPFPIRRLCQTNSSLPQPDIVPVPNPNPPIENIDQPPKYSPPPSYSKAIGFRVAKALRNSIRRSARIFRRSEESRNESIESDHQNIVTISSSVRNSTQNVQQLSQPNRNINDFLRSTISRTCGTSQSVEHLMMSDISLNERSIDNQVSTRSNVIGNLI